MASIKTIGFGVRNDQALGAVIDVSRHGIRLRTGQPPQVGQIVQLRLGIGEKIHEFVGVSRRIEWFDKVFDVCVEWIDCTEEQLAVLDEVSAQCPSSR